MVLQPELLAQEAHDGFELARGGDREDFATEVRGGADRVQADRY